MIKIYKLFRTVILWLTISLMALTPLHAYAAHAGDDTHQAPGGLRIGLLMDQQTILLVDEPALVKNALDQGWSYARDEWHKRIVNLINNMGDQETVKVVANLTTADRTTFLITKIANRVDLHYVLPGNQISLTLRIGWPLGELAYKVTFDLELVLTVQAPNPGEQLHITDVALNLQNAQIEGLNLVSVLARPVAMELFQHLQAFVSEAGRTLLPILQEASDQFIKTISPPLPSAAIYLEVGADSIHNMILLCFKANADATCVFPPQ